MINKFSRLTTLMACSLAVLFFTSFQIYAAVNDIFTIDNMKYAVLAEEDSTGTVSVGRNSNTISGSIVIPDSVENNGITYSVTEIGERAFSGCSSLTSVTIPDSVTSIESRVFQDCRSLTNIVIPDSVTSIGNGAFSGCDQLPAILFSTGKKILVRYSSSHTEISYTIPDTVTYIAGSAFSGCNSLKNITIPNGVTEIGVMAFSGCRSLTSIVIPDSVTSIGNWAFSECNSLKNITIPNGVTEIGVRAFSGCSSLTSVVIPDSVTSIGDSAFYGCNSLHAITIPDSVITIENNAFNHSRVRSAIIGKNVKYIGTSAFSSGVSLYFTGNAPINIGRSGTGIIYYLEGTEGWNDTLSDYTLITCKGWNIVNHVIYVCKSEEMSAFVSGKYSNEGRLNGIIIKETVQIGTDTYPVTSIAAGAFLSDVMNIIIPNSVKSIGEHAFGYGWKLYFEGDIPDNISLYIFGDDGIITYNSFIYYIEGTKGWDDFINENNFIDGKVEKGSRFVFCKGCKGWSVIDQIIYICKEGEETASVSGSIGRGKTFVDIWDTVDINSKNYPVDIIGDYAFLAYHKLENVIIPESVKSIGERAFSECRNLVSIKIPNNVHTIETEAFLWCYNLKNIIIGCGIKTIEKNAFYTSESTSPQIRMNVYFNGDSPKDFSPYLTFNNYDPYIYYLENAEGFDKISSYSRVCCKGWSVVDGIIYVCKQDEDTASVTGFIGTPTNVTIQNTININAVDYPVTDVCLKWNSRINSAFYNCGTLNSIIIPDSVTFIGRYAFYDCSSLRSVYFEGNAPYVGPDAFSNTSATIYYRDGTEGWTNPWGWRPTVMIPNLSCLLESDVMLLKWTAGTDVVLQVSESAVDGWDDITESVQTEDGSCVYKAPTTAKQGFYRLKMP